jgi:hypothetical protein
MTKPEEQNQSENCTDSVQPGVSDSTQRNEKISEATVENLKIMWDQWDDFLDDECWLKSVQWIGLTKLEKTERGISHQT